MKEVLKKIDELRDHIQVNKPEGFELLLTQLGFIQNMIQERGQFLGAEGKLSASKQIEALQLQVKAVQENMDFMATIIGESRTLIEQKLNETEGANGQAAEDYLAKTVIWAAPKAAPVAAEQAQGGQLAGDAGAVAGEGNGNAEGQAQA